MLFNYVAVDNTNIQREGTVEAVTIDAAITAIQKRGYTVVSIDPVQKGRNLKDLLNIDFQLFNLIPFCIVVVTIRSSNPTIHCAINHQMG